MKVFTVIYNFTYENVPNVHGTYLEKQTKFDAANVGYNGVEKIIYHTPMGDGDKHYCDIYYDNGRKVRVFNINEIIFKEEEYETK